MGDGRNGQTLALRKVPNFFHLVIMSFDHLDDFMFLNPITEAKIVGDGISSDRYMKQPNGVKRGSPEFVMNGKDLSLFSECPHRWLHGYSEDDEGTKATDWGSLLDCFLTSKQDLFDRFILLPANYQNDKGEDRPWNWNANVCKAWREENNAAGLKTEIKREVWFSAKEAADLILADPQLEDLFANSRKQVMLTGVYVDKETGVRVPVKSLLDLVPNEATYLVDLKSCNCAHPRAWRKQVFNFNYHVQASRHLDLWNAATGEQRNEFRHVLQESVKPFEVAKRFLSSEYLALGRQKYIGALKRYAKALHTGVWETYDIQEGANDMVIDGWLIVSPEPWMIGV